MSGKMGADSTVIFLPIIFLSTLFSWSPLAPAARVAPVETHDWFIGIISQDRAIHFTTNGAFIEDAGGLLEVRGIDCGPDGDIYIGDNSNRVSRFARNEFQFRTTVVDSSEIDSPMAVRFGPDGDMYVIAPSGEPDRIDKWEGPLTDSPFTYDGTFAEVKSNLIGFIDCEFGPNGDLFVSNWKTPAGAPDPSIELFDGVNGDWVESYVTTNEPNLDNVRGITIGPDGHLYVANYPPTAAPAGEILRYQGPSGVSPGAFMDIFVSNGVGGVDLPQGITFGNDSNLYVSSHFTFSTLRYQGPFGASPGAFIDTFASYPGLTNGTPLFMAQATDPELRPRPIEIGDWIVSLTTNNSVRRYDADGNYVDGVGGLVDVRGVSFDPTGNVYVVHQDFIGAIGQLSQARFESFANVALLSNMGTGVLKYGGDGNIYAVTAATPHRIGKWRGVDASTPFSFVGFFTEFRAALIAMQDFEFGPDGHLYVSNRETPGLDPNSSVQRFNGSSGAYIDAFIPTTDTQLVDVAGIAFGLDGNLYAANRGGSNEILRYQGPNGASPGTFMDVFVTNGSGGLDSPQDIHFGIDSNLYVCSSASFEILRYQGPGGGSPGAFIDVFARFHTNSYPQFITQILPAPAPPPDGTVIGFQ